MSKYRYGRYIDIILKRMCKAVGADFNKIDFQKDGWYKKYSWTSKQSAKFWKWFAEYLYTNKKATCELYGRAMSKKACKEAVHWFNLMYGWKQKE